VPFKNSQKTCKKFIVTYHCYLIFKSSLSYRNPYSKIKEICFQAKTFCKLSTSAVNSPITHSFGRLCMHSFGLRTLDWVFFFFAFFLASPSQFRKTALHIDIIILPETTNCQTKQLLSNLLQ